MVVGKKRLQVIEVLVGQCHKLQNNITGIVYLCDNVKISPWLKWYYGGWQWLKEPMNDSVGSLEEE